jgi:putative endonuclease
MPVFFVYIIYSPIINQYYVSHTDDLSDRFFRHINSGSKATKKVNDWQLVYKEMMKKGAKHIEGKWKLKRKKVGNTLPIVVSHIMISFGLVFFLGGGVVQFIGISVKISRTITAACLRH